MIRSRIRRLSSVLTVATLGALLVGISPVSAANPDWDIEITSLPSIVAAGNGNDAGYFIKVINRGPSNINDLTVTVTPTDTPTAEPTYLSPLVYKFDGTADCHTLAPLTCYLGTLEDDEEVSFTVAWEVPAGLTGKFDIEVALRAGTGDPDGKNNSRGDKYAELGSTTISASKNFDGGFVVAADTYQTNPDLGPRNIQSTALEGTAALIPVTIEDGISSLTECDSALDNAACASLFGEWSRLNVNGGNAGVPYATAFKVTLMVRGNAVPGGTDASDIQVVHVLDNGSIEIISQACTYDTDNHPTNAECLTATKVGSNWKIEVWLFKNGAVRGGI